MIDDQRSQHRTVHHLHTDWSRTCANSACWTLVL